MGTGWHKKTVITKNQIIPKFYLDWHKTSATLGQACVADISKVSSLYYKNSLFYRRSKNVLQMSSPALQAHLDPAGKVLDDPPAFLPWDRSYCCCDCCLQVRDSLGVVAIHSVLKVSPTDKNMRCSNPVNAATTAGHTCGWSVGQGNAAVAMPIIRLRSGGWHHPAGTTVGPWRPLSVDQVLSRTCQAPGHIARCWLSQTARCRPRTRMVQWCCLEMATQAVHFTECNGICRQCLGGVLPQKMLLLEFTWPDNR